jgi:SPP1 gp7 family putative phage head morphogenesis protein
MTLKRKPYSTRRDAREVKKKPKRELVPKTRGYPLSIERKFQKTLTGYIKEIEGLVNELIVPMLDGLSKEARGNDTRKTDSLERNDTYVTDFLKYLNLVKLAYQKRIPDQRIELDTQDMALSTSSFQKTIFDNQFKSVLGVAPFISEPWLKEVLENSVQKNVSLIKSAHESYFKDIETFVLEGLEQGRLARDIGADIAKRTGVSLNKGRLIARDQVGKLNTSLASRRASAAGVKTFVWSTSKDERVRPSHEELEGQKFSYKEGVPSLDGANNVLPGQPINCRCVAIPVISSIDNGEDDE